MLISAQTAPQSTRYARAGTGLEAFCASGADDRTGRGPGKQESCLFFGDLRQIVLQPAVSKTKSAISVRILLSPLTPIFIKPSLSRKPQLASTPCESRTRRRQSFWVGQNSRRTDGKSQLGRQSASTLKRVRPTSSPCPNSEAHSAWLGIEAAERRRWGRKCSHKQPQLRPFSKVPSAPKPLPRAAFVRSRTEKYLRQTDWLVLSFYSPVGGRN